MLKNIDVFRTSSNTSLALYTSWTSRRLFGLLKRPVILNIWISVKFKKSRPGNSAVIDFANLGFSGCEN